jgi:hypothetical protein
METLLIRGFETVMLLMAILTTGALLGVIAGRLTFGAYMRKSRGKLAAHDRLRDDTDRTRVNLHVEIAKAIFADRSARSRKGWETRRAERERQRDADIKMLMGME